MDIHTIGGFNEVGKNMTAVKTGEDVVLLDRTHGALDVPQAQLADEGPGIGPGGTARRAGRVVAEEAPRGLGDRLRPGVSRRHLGDVLQLVGLACR